MLLESEQQTYALGVRLAKALVAGDVVYLQGDLACGKTTLSRAMIQALGFSGHVKSPTFTLVEQYTLPQFDINHFDLYRLNDIEELYVMGFKEYFHPSAVCLIEWPEKAMDYLPKPSWEISMLHHGDMRKAFLKHKDHSVEF